MRVAFLAAVVFISACASDGLNLAPPPGVDFSGHWQLNVADSDDPVHLLQLANSQAASAADNAGTTLGQRAGRCVTIPRETTRHQTSGRRSHVRLFGSDACVSARWCQEV